MLTLTPPEKPDSVLRALAASGLKGSVKARKELSRRTHEQLRREISNA